MIRLANIKMKPDHDYDALVKKSARLLKLSPKNILRFKISKKSLDARDKANLKFVYSVDVEVKHEEKYLSLPGVSSVKPYEYLVKHVINPGPHRPIVVGSGPAGLFAGLILAESGLTPVILERGKDVDARKQDVESLWQHGALNPDSNALFGEGGAGTFSDGKLTTGTKDPRIGKVIRELVRAGAPEEIEYLAKPHIGTDNLIGILKHIRGKIISLGGEFRFNTKFTGFTQRNSSLKSITVEGPEGTYELEARQLILAIGHSARDTFEMLYENGTPMKQKPFSVGLRIEHGQEFINISQYGPHGDPKLLGAADYKLSARLSNGRGVYTFCMCPGGVVVASASEQGCVVTNGMSLFSRAGKNANSALLVSVGCEDFRTDHPLAGVDFQRKLESRAFALGGGDFRAPAQLVRDFLNGIPTEKFGSIQPSYMPGVTPCDLSPLFAGCEFIADGLKEGIACFDKKLHGFADTDAVLTGVETRSSSPVTITRDSRTLMSDLCGLFPCGEGAGYAGGIISAAVDGIRVAEAVIGAGYDS